MRGPRPSRVSCRVHSLAILLARGLTLAAALVISLPAPAAAQGIVVHGRVEDDAKRPIAGATARLYPVLGLHQAGELHVAGAYPPPAAAEARSSADGTFTLDAPRAGHWRLVVGATGRAERQSTLGPLVEETWLRAVALPGEAPLQVRVVSPKGAPVAGALVAAALGMERGWFAGSWSAPTALLRTGPDGRVAVACVRRSLRRRRGRSRLRRGGAQGGHGFDPHRGAP